MKQIIVSLHWLSVEEKQRVNTALAKIAGATKLPDSKIGDGWLFATPALDGMMITSDWLLSYGEPTHTPEEVLEMAGMTEKHKVRKDFDPKRAYSVDVSNCIEDEKKKIQQAFFDAGFLWRLQGKEYLHLGAEQYSNMYSDGTTSDYCLFGEVREGSMTPKEFLELVYEPEYQGHPHARLMAQYAEDAKFTDEPWELWQIKNCFDKWSTCENNPARLPFAEYRRKPKTKLIHGVEIPDISFVPEDGEEYYRPDIDIPQLYDVDYYERGFLRDEVRIKGNRCYPYTKEGKKAAIQHSKALLGIAD